jgi:tRNA(fMet)-specific endonuclease VapC
VKLRHLLDTDSVSDLVLRPQGVVAAQIGRRGETSVCTSIVVAAELRFGAAKRGSARLTRQVEAVLSALEVLPLEHPADRRYGALRDHLEREGAPIGPNDMLIAAHALSLGLTVVTGNVKEFSRVPGLTVENWLAIASEAP